MLAATAGLAACGGGDKYQGSALGPTSSESPTTAGTSPSASGSTTALTPANLLQAVAATQIAQGSYRYKSTAGTGNGRVVTKAGAVVGKKAPRLSGTVSLGGAKYDVISTNGKVYARGGALGDTRWVAARLGATSGVATVIGALGATDPTRTLVLLGAATSVSNKGTARAGGTSTRRLSVFISRATFLQSHNLSGAKARRVPDSYTVDLYLDKQNLLVKEVLTTRGKGRTESVTTTFSDYGKAVEVAAPSASVAAPA